MTAPTTSIPSLTLRFPRLPDQTDLNYISLILQDLSLIYETTVIATTPSYGHVWMPSNQLGPRRWSRLLKEDRVQVESISLASPLTFVLVSVGVLGPRLIKSWTGVIAAGLDILERIDAIRENRALAPERLRSARLDNALKEQELRRVTADADLVARAQAEVPEADYYTQIREIQNRTLREYSPRRADSLDPEDFALLMDHPMQRLLGYGGGEIEISEESNDDASDDHDDE